MKPQDNSATHILFADQDVVLCVSARRALQRVGFAVTLAHDGADALDRFWRDPFDLVVVGAALPARNGLQVLREIKKSSPATPVILIGDLPSELSALAQKEGASAYLPIPTDTFDELINTIDRAIMLRETLPPPPPPVESPPVAQSPAIDETEQIATLRELIEAIPYGTLPESIQLLLQACADTVRAVHAVLLLADSESGLQLHDAIGFSDQTSAARDFVRHVGDAFAWRVATERHTLVDYEPAFASEAPKGFIGTPLLLRGQVLGVLVAYPLPNHPVDPASVAWLETFAAQGALAIQLSRLDDENKRLSPIDPLTGALKPNVFLDLAEREFRRSWRYNQPISAIVVDVDGMHDINARGGEEFGDLVLRHIATVCRNTMRSIDLVGRYEGDSFALLLLMTDRAGAKNAAERLRAGVGSIHLSDAQGAVRVTVTLGVCSYPRDNCASIFDLLNMTKEAQRAARRTGANQIVQV